MRIALLIASAAALLACAAAHADDANPELKRNDEFYVALFGDAMVRPDNKHVPELKRSYALDARFGYLAENHWGYEVRAFYGKLNPKSASEAKGNRSGIGGDAIYRFPSLLGARPYLLGGVGIAYSDLVPGADWIAPYVNVGAGLSISTVELWQHPLRIRAEARYAYEDYRDEYVGSKTFLHNNYLDVHAFVGIEFALTRHVPEPPPPKPEVVPPVESPPEQGAPQ